MKLTAILASRVSIVVIPLALAGCAGSPPIVSASSPCSALLPEAWREPVPGAPLPNGETVGDWIAFADAQTGRLDMANDRLVSSIGIVERCSARDQQAIEAANRKWWEFWR